MLSFSLPIVPPSAPAHWLSRLLLLLAFCGGAALTSQAQSITSFSPASGVPGTQVTIQTTGFGSSSYVQVSFGDQTNNNAYVSVGPNGDITLPVPAGSTTGPIYLRQSTNSGAITTTSSGTFTVPQSLASFSPASGVPGTQVTIQTTGFGSSSVVQVSFGDQTNNSVYASVGPNGDITLPVPAGSSTGPIYLRQYTRSGAVITASSGTFTVPLSINSFSPTSGAVGTQVTIQTTGFGSSNSPQVSFGSQYNTSVYANVSSNGALTVTVPAGSTTGPIYVRQFTSSGSVTTASSGTFTVNVPPADLTISTSGQTIAAGTYNSITVNRGGGATLTGNVTVNSAVTVNDGGTLSSGVPGCYTIGGAGSFTLAAGGTLAICDAAGISSSGATGTVQVTGARSFSPDASYRYNGTAAQATGTGLPGTVRALVLDNAQGATLGANLTATTNLTLTSGVLATGGRTATLGSAATLTESASSYVTGTVQTTRDLSTADATETFGGLGLSLTPSGATLPGSTLVIRTTGTARTGAGASQSVKRVFDIQPTVKTGLNVALALTVRDDELNGIAAANLRLFKSDNNGATWYLQPSATVATTAASGSQPTTYTASLGGVPNFSLWTLGDVANPLPVVLTQFTAVAAGPSAVRLAWATASEANSAAFEVQRSADGATWATLGTVAAAGTSTTAHTYGYLDAAAPTGAGYYRLRQVDADGTASYSPVRAVVLTGAGAGLALYPNPTTTAATLSGAQPGTLATVYDALGRPVLATTADATGTAVLVLPAGLPTGVYVVRAGTRALRLTVE